MAVYRLSVNVIIALLLTGWKAIPAILPEHNFTMSKRNTICLLLMHCLCTELLLAQLDVVQFERYTTLAGLNHNHVLSITQDSIGFMWLGTEAGPMRYDGTSFTALTTLNPSYADKEPLTFNLSTLDENEIGISTNYGAFVLNVRDYQFKALQYPVDDELSSWAYSTFDIGKDKAGNYGLSSKTGFYVFDDKAQLVDEHHVYTAADIGTSWMLYGRAVLQLPDGMMFQKNTSGINYFNPVTKKIEVNTNHYQLDTALMASDPEIRFAYLSPTHLVYYAPLRQELFMNDLVTGHVYSSSIPVDIQYNLNWSSKLAYRNDSTLVLSAKVGVYFINVDRSHHTIRIDPSLQLPEVEVTALYTDRDGRLWIGTFGGLLKEKTTVPVQSIPFSLPGQSSPIQIKWLEKGEGVWYASTLHDGLLILDEYTFQIKKQIIPRLRNDNVRLNKMIWYDAEHLWICSSEGIMEYEINSGAYHILTFPHCPQCTEGIVMHELFRDRDGDIWMSGSETNAAYHLDHRTGDLERIEHSPANPKFKINIVYRFSEDKDGNIWFCGDALARFNKAEHRIDSLVEKLPLQNNSRKVFLMFLNSQHEMWFSNNGDNWNIYNETTGWSVLQDSKLSPDLNKYETIIGDDLYYISRQGKIVVLNTLTRKYRILSAQDGWDQEIMRSFGFFKDPLTQAILFAGDNTIYRFQTEPTQTYAMHVPFISEISVLGKRQVHYPATHLHFASDEHTMQVKFVTLNYDDPGNEMYAYRLTGNSNMNWITIDKPDIILTQIPSGHYKLEFRVMSKNNDWLPSTKSYDLSIRFPIYRQWWFIVASISILAMAIYLIVMFRIRQMRLVSSLDRQVIEYELKALHAQMNPHFVFNCLNSIKEMIISRDNKHANIYLNKFSYLLRSTLEQSKLSFVPLRHTADYLTQYLEMEKLRFSHFNYKIEIQPDLETDTIMIAPLLLQPIVENAIWHGKSEHQQEDQLIIRFYACKDDIICEVEDFGVGMQASKNAVTTDLHLSSALENITKRIELLNRKYDVDYRLTIIDKSVVQSGKGTLVKLAFKHQPYEFD